MNNNRVSDPPPERNVALEELKAIRLELVALRKLIDAFAAAFLNAKFPHGRPSDPWGRR